MSNLEILPPMHCHTCGAPGYNNPCSACVGKARAVKPVVRTYALEDYPRYRNLIVAVKGLAAGAEGGGIPCDAVVEMVENLARYGIGEPEPLAEAVPQGL